MSELHRVFIGAARFLGRVFFLAFFLLTSAYCLFAYVPFTWEQLLKPEVVRPLAVFAHLHPWLYLAAIAIGLVTVLDDLRRNRGLVIFFGALALGGVSLVVHPVLTSVGGTPAALAWSFLFLLPLLAWPITASKSVLAAMPDQGMLDSTGAFHAAWQSAFLMALLYAGIASSRGAGASLGFTLLWSIPAHLMVSMGAFVVLHWIGAAASSFGRARRVEVALTQCVAVVLLWVTIRGLLISAASFSGPWAEVFSAAMALAISAFSAFAFAPAAPGTRPAWPAAVMLPAIGTCAVLVTIRIAPLDGSFLMQKLTAGIAWLAVFLVLYRWPLLRVRLVVPAGAALALAVVAPLGYRALQASPLRVRDEATLTRQAALNPSFRLIRDWMPASGSQGDGEFYRFLARNTNIPRSVSVAPVSVDLVDRLEPDPRPKPNIFLFVIDSLRRDYLAPYNPSVTFTPRISEFAADAVAFDNAFTRYGATGLAEPSIWVGGMMLHKQYVMPFAPMNSLAKLLQVDGYDVLLSRDTILSTILGPSRGEDLDQSRANMNYRFCSTLTEIEGRLAGRTSSQPLFVYTQPQDIHISVIQREGAKTVGSGAYGGFYEPYASRLERMDACFGEFMEFLKKQNLYDHSIVILTSDHGDSLGEQGRWGHAYTVFPEVLRIPLIIHLPQELRTGLAYDPKSPAFSADITPSLFALLGHGPVRRSPLFGRSLFTDPPATAAQDAFLVASSYGAAYGLLTGNGRHLFISDATEYRDHAFDLSASPAERPFDPAEQASARRQIREKILEINRFYGFSRPSTDPQPGRSP